MHSLTLLCCLNTHALWARLTFFADECSVFARDPGVSCRYHSHPIFAPKPSQKDNENQRNYQALFRCATSTLEPFLGAIVGPYDVQLPSPVGKTPGCCMACLVPSMLCRLSNLSRDDLDCLLSAYRSLRAAQAFLFISVRLLHQFFHFYKMAGLVLSGFMHYMVCRADSARSPGALPCASQSKRAAGASR